MSIRNLWRHVPSIIIALAFLLPITVWLVRALGNLGKPHLGLDLLVPLLIRTHTLALIVATVTVITAAPAALFCRIAAPSRALGISVILIAPIFVGMLARNYSWIGMLSGDNIFTSFGWSLVHGDKLLFTPTAVYLVMAFVFTPWAVFIMKLALASVSEVQIEAATTLGATPYNLVLKVLGPSLMRGALLSFLLIYCSSLGYFITPKMLGGNAGDLAGNVIMRFMELADFSSATTVSLVLLATSAPFAIAFLWFIQRQQQFED